jgi:methyl-accepting chemotaxis protein
MPFTTSAINDIKTLDRYGKNIIPTIFNYNSLPAAQETLNSRQQQVTLQMVPPGQQNSFQVIGKPVSIVPWNYYVLSPTSVVTALADQQLLTIGFIALVVLLLAAATGLIVGRRITSPVLRSVKKLQSSSHLLQELAAKEQVTITEQVWIVDSSQTGLSSVNYYLEAAQQAARRMLKVGADMEQHWPDMNQAKVREALKKIMVAAQYIESAAHYQKASSQKLSATIDLTKQVTDQLSLSADSATNAAQQMEQVVTDLQQVVGKN